MLDFSIRVIIIKHRMVLCLLSIFMCCGWVAAQTGEEVRGKVEEAIIYIDKGEIEKALMVLNEISNLSPDATTIEYQKALSLHIEKKYQESIEVIKTLLNKKDVFYQLYQLMGNNYDRTGESKKAIKYYNLGIKKFPNAGRLYLEKGRVMDAMGLKEEAQKVWEEGILSDPYFSSNYYVITKAFATGLEKIWAIYYAEMFLNLEPYTDRSDEISKLLYDTYRQCLPMVAGKRIISFSNKAKNFSAESEEDYKLSFETTHHLAMLHCVEVLEGEVNISDLAILRRQFVEEWNNRYAMLYPNVIFSYHELIKKYDFTEAYMYWMLRSGHKEEFDRWKEMNTTYYFDFLSWIRENPIMIIQENQLTRQEL